MVQKLDKTYKVPSPTMASKTLTPSQAAQLAGFASARKAGSEGMADRGAKGGAVTAERHGREHFVRIAHQRWGRLQGRG